MTHDQVIELCETIFATGVFIGVCILCAAILLVWAIDTFRRERVR